LRRQKNPGSRDVQNVTEMEHGLTAPVQINQSPARFSRRSEKSLVCGFSPLTE
jgi:hypothetical protein